MKNLDALREASIKDWDIESMAKAVEDAFREQDEEEDEDTGLYEPSWEQRHRPYTI